MENQKEIRKDDYDAWNELFLEAGYGRFEDWSKFRRHDRKQIINYMRHELEWHKNKFRKIIRNGKLSERATTMDS